MIKKSNDSSKKMDNDDSYKVRRVRNNDAVKKSRTKSKTETNKLKERLKQLHEENVKLEEKNELYKKELNMFKKLIMEQTTTSNPPNLTAKQMKFLKEEIDSD